MAISDSPIPTLEPLRRGSRGAGSAGGAGTAGARTSPRRLWIDRAAKGVVTAGGLAIIASILGILLFIFLEVAPLARAPKVSPVGSTSVPGRPAALFTDPYLALVATAGSDGSIRVARLADGSEVVSGSLLELPRAAGGGTVATDPEVPAATEPPAPPTLVTLESHASTRSFAATTSDGRVLTRTVSWDVTFGDDGARRIGATLSPTAVLALDPAGAPLGAFATQIQGAERSAAAAQLADGRVVVVRQETTTNAFSGETDTSEDRIELAAVPRLEHLVLDHEIRNLFAGTATGDILWWSLDAGDDAAPEIVSAGSSPVSAVAMLIGDRSLVVGQENGAVSIWFPVRSASGGGEQKHLTRIRDFPAHRAAIAAFAPSERNRSFFAADRDGGLGLYFSTSERTLWEGRVPEGAAPEALAMAPKGDAAVFAGDGRVSVVAVDNPHPEVSWKALFGKVHYEGYDEPSYTWQSTGGTDDFESKLSLTPLVVGTLKGTFFSLLLAIPLGILGAMFASQFLHPKLLDVVKPTVEIMAALPSVVLGFLAGLWLAPVLEEQFPTLLLALVLGPLFVWIAGLGWNALPLAVRGRYPVGAEVFLYVAAILLSFGAAGLGAPAFERIAFGGNFQAWLLHATGLPYDQRNAVVVGLAMGFAVIPIIFAISEDAFSNVPRNLVSGSLALGANRWQTVTRVVLPTASPGIFSAIMIGFGRAIGETMIVLMATGNTPILSMNPFNGFRTLSANIAVEIPEAPHGGTLYRALFLAALLLFFLTFLLNTAAELVRQRLRRKFAQL